MIASTIAVSPELKSVSTSVSVIALVSCASSNTKSSAAVKLKSPAVVSTVSVPLKVIVASSASPRDSTMLSLS